MNIDISASVRVDDGELKIKASVINVGSEAVSMKGFHVVLPDGGTLDMNRSDGSASDLSRFSLRSGYPFWFRIRAHYQVEGAQSGYLIKDCCVQLSDEADSVDIAFKVREQEAIGMLAYWSQDFSTAASHFGLALSEYENENCAFAIRELLQTYAYVLLMLGRVDEAGFQLRSALEAGDNKEAAPIRVRLLCNLANVQLLQGQANAARATCEEILELGAELGDRASVGFAEAAIGSSYKVQGDDEQAEMWLRRGVATARIDRDRLALSRRLSTLGFLLSDIGQGEAASVSLTESLSIATDIRDFQYVEETSMYLYKACEMAGDYTGFVTTVERLLEVLPDGAFLDTRIHVLNSLGSVYSTWSQDDRAVERWERALAIARGAGKPIEESVVLGNLGEHYGGKGRSAEAEVFLREAVRTAAAAGAWSYVKMLRDSFARLAGGRVGGVEEAKTEQEYADMIAEWWFSQSPAETETDEPSAGDSAPFPRMNL